MENDITLFKKSLEILQNLDEKYKLYTKVAITAENFYYFL